MTIRIYITSNVSIIVGIAKELLPRISKTYVFDIEPEHVLLYDILVTYNMGEIAIRDSGEELICSELDFDFNFIAAVENVVIKKSSDFIYHGSAITYDNIFTLAFVGFSGSGKTTIVERLESCSSKFKRISDDLLIVNGTQLYKNYLPTKVRIKSESNDVNSKLIKPPTLFDPALNDKMLDLSMVVSIKFCPSSIDSFVRLDTFDSIETLVSNSRSAPDNLSLMQHVSNIIKHIPIYSLNYRDDNYAIECLLNALNIRLEME